MKSHDFPILYDRAQTGGVKYWSIRSEENSNGTAGVRVSHGLITATAKSKNIPDKLQTTVDTIKTGKNIGKKNETTPYEQAYAEAQSKWQEKCDKGYVETLGKIDEERDVIEPMLAHKFEERGGYIKDDDKVFLQAKLDGVRCIARCDKDGNIRLYSRSGKIFPGARNVVKDLAGVIKPGQILDGELYNHEAMFEEIVAAVKKDGPDRILLEYWIFDIVTEGSWEERFCNGLLEENLEGTCIRKVPFEMKHFSREQLDRFHDGFVAMGFEGVMIRPADGTPYQRKRSNKLLKYKKFQDAEFQIVGADEGKGKLAGHLGAFKLKVKAADGTWKTFGARVKCTMEKAKRLWESRADYIGKMATVKFQNLTEDGIPRFPVLKAIRDE